MVITILAVMAALVVPNFVAIKKSRDIRYLEMSLRRLPEEARQEARSRNSTVALRVEGNAVIMERRPATEEEGDPEEIKRIELPDDFQVENGRNGLEDTDAASWEWVVYPDGSTVGGGLRFRESQTVKYLQMPSTGEAQWRTSEEDDDDDGNAPWPAGDLERRG